MDFPRAGAGDDPQVLKMTPLELDMQLQACELIFRSILEGKRLGIAPETDIEEWLRNVQGEAWVGQKEMQQRENLQRMSENGENTPVWMESLANMGDIAWEIFQNGTNGEVVRKLEDVDRTEIIEQFKDLYPKVRISYYARCGAGERLYGLRACIAIFRLFVFDAEVLDLCATCLKEVIHDNEYNRNGLAELSLPMPPAQRSLDDPEKGWAFMRAAFDAFMVQAGEEPHSWKPLDHVEKGSESGESDAEDCKVPERICRLSVALKIAECIIAVRSTPAFSVQMKMLREPLPFTPALEWKEMQQMLPRIHEKIKELLSHDDNQVLQELLEIVQLGLNPDLKQPGDGDDVASGEGTPPDDEGVVPLGTGRVRGFVGRGSIE